MEKVQRSLFTAIIAGESIHIFCCFLPSLISIVNLLASAGIMITLPGFIDDFHHMIHNYEIPMIIGSGVLLIAGWAVYIYANKLNCSTDPHCSHGECLPRKKTSKKIMVAATALFIFNVTIYMTLHYDSEAHAHDDATPYIEQTHKK